jgi:peroxiredoxin Q/BCP
MVNNIKEGLPVANFTAVATDGAFSLADHKGKNVVIYFYPKDNTPGCTTEGNDFSALYDSFQERNTVIYGVSKDSLKTHENFRTKYQFRFHLISDKDEIVCRHFDVIKLKKMYGREYEGIERSTFLINHTGELVKEWRKVKVKGHAEEVLAAVNTLT